MYRNLSFHNCRGSKLRYPELLNNKLKSIKQGSLTVNQYCNKLEFIINELNRFQVCLHLNNVLLYRFVTGLNCRLRHIIQSERAESYPDAKRIALLFE